jgi:DNA polymerase-3 subunit delta
VIVVLYGADQLGIRRRLQELRELADGGTGMIATNIAEIEGRDARPAEILAAAMTPPFLSAKRMVVVHGLVDRFEPRPGERRTRSLDSFAPLLEAIEKGLPKSTILVLTGEGAGRQNPLLEALKKLVKGNPELSLEERSLTPGDVPRLINDEAAARGLALGPGVAAALAKLIGPDSLTIANELDKLSLYALGRRATIEDVEALSSGNRESKMYELTDAAMDGDVVTAQRTLRTILLGGADSQEVIAGLLTAYRRVATIVGLLAEGATPEQIGVATKMQYPGLRDQAIQRARRLGPGGVRAAWELIVGADRSIKTGQTGDEVAVEVLVGQLCRLAPKGTTAGLPTR